MRRDLLVLEWPEDLGRTPGGELAGDLVIEEPVERILAGRRLVGNDVMTRSTADAVARQSAIFEVLARDVGVLDPIELEVRLGAGVVRRSRIVAVIGVELTFPHHTVAAEADIH